MMNRTSSIPGAPRATLSNGLVLVNFSSPHPFKFTDGTVLPACPPDRVKALPLRRSEMTLFNHEHGGTVWSSMSVNFVPSTELLDELGVLEVDDTVDIIIVPRVCLDAIKTMGRPVGKARTIMVADRDHGENRDKLNYIDRFCI